MADNPFLQRARERGWSPDTDNPPAPAESVFVKRARERGWSPDALIVTDRNYIDLADREIRFHEGQGRPTSALAKQAIVEQYRVAAGLDPTIGVDHRKQAQAAINKRNPAAGFAGGFGASVGGFGADVMSLVSPKTGQRMAAANEAYYGPNPGGVAGTVGQVVGEMGKIVPALATGTAGPLLAAQFGLAGAGGVRRDVADRRDAGQDISVEQEWTAALATGGVEAASGLISARLFGAMGSALTSLGPGVYASFRVGGKGMAAKFLMNRLPRLLGAEAAEMTEEALTQIAGNAILKATGVAPEQPLLAGAREAAKMAAILTPLLGPFAGAAQKGATPTGLAGVPDLGPPGSILRVRSQVERSMLTAQREHRAKVAFANQTARKWETKFSGDQLQDIGASVENIGRVDKPGETAHSVQARMTPEMRKMETEYAKAQEEARNAVNDFIAETNEETYIAFLEQYLPHFYAQGRSKFKGAGKWLIANSPNAKKRKLPTLEDAVNAGLVPVTQNVATLHRMWSNINWRVATAKRFLSDLSTTTLPDGTAVILPVGKAPADWVKIDHPALQKIYGAKSADGKTVLWRGGAAVHPEIAPFIKAITEKPFTNKFVWAYEGLNAWAKKTALSLSLFHHIALTESSNAVLAKAINPVRGAILIGEVDPTTGRRTITQPHRIGVRLMQSPKFLEDAIRHGLTLEASSDAFVTRVAKDLSGLERRLRNIPVLGKAAKVAGKFNKWWDKALWDHYHSGLKAFAYHDLVAKALVMRPDMSPTAVKETIADFLNDAYGGQEWENTVFRNPKVKQVAQWAMLAPDWTWSNLKIAGQTVLSDPSSLRGQLQLRYWRNMIPSLMGSAVGLQAAIFFAFGDEEKGDTLWTWDNEEGKKWDIDVTPLLRNLPGHKVERGKEKQRSYTHFGKQAREVLGWLEDPLRTAERKTSPNIQIVREQFFGTKGAGFDVPWSNDQFWSSFGGKTGRAVGVLDKFIPFSFRGNNFAFSAPMAKGATPWKGRTAIVKELRAYADPSLLAKAVRDQENWEESLESLVSDTLEALERNGHPSRKLFGQALGIVRGEQYRRFFTAMSKQDFNGMEKAAESIIRLHAWLPNLIQSARNRNIDLTSEELTTLIQVFEEAQRNVLGEEE